MIIYLRFYQIYVLSSSLHDIAERNRQNRTHQNMTYRRGRTSIYQLKDDFVKTHQREPDRMEVFRMRRYKDLSDGTQRWVDDESYDHFERMTQMTTHSLQSDDAAPVSAEDAFIAVMGRDRPAVFVAWVSLRRFALGMGGERDRAPQEATILRCNSCSSYCRIKTKRWRRCLQRGAGIARSQRIWELRCQRCKPSCRNWLLGHHICLVLCLSLSLRGVMSPLMIMMMMIRLL
ncbi:hypothetical protein Taro_034388 [Colocasia esculenta]|uniref:Uncharacterized protein n=1 Tax=Colocasia esculenta TaxID=4460 RepID=A0A843W2S8_COLES|nr:hypothetical protein [Colocasia esculenta]